MIEVSASSSRMIIVSFREQKKSQIASTGFPAFSGVVLFVSVNVYSPEWSVSQTKMTVGFSVAGNADRINFGERLISIQEDSGAQTAQLLAGSVHGR